MVELNVEESHSLIKLCQEIMNETTALFLERNNGADLQDKMLRIRFDKGLRMSLSSAPLADLKCIALPRG